MSQPVELLAPAGGIEAAWAAIANGADAIYLGLGRFSARAEAANFTAGQLEAIVAHAHAQTPRRRVYVALNTLVAARELDGAWQSLRTAYEADVDAIIVQDFGILRLVRREFPDLRLHSSTQMAVHNREGAEVLLALGASRVTLARELTLAEIAEISQLPIETESFVHGALCYSYSGLCLYSSLVLGRSGNRGRCAQPCRNSCRLLGDPPPGPTGRTPPAGLAFSMKDLALADRLDDLRQTGVAALKIEGRMKNHVYVGAVTDFYRRSLDGRLTGAEQEARLADLRTVFSRSWTDLYVDGRRGSDVVDPEVTGHRGSPIGTVETVFSKDGSDWLRFTTSREMQVHDGLAVILPDHDHAYGFPIDTM